MVENTYNHEADTGTRNGAARANAEETHYDAQRHRGGGEVEGGEPFALV